MIKTYKKRIRCLVSLLRKMKYDPITGYINRHYFEYVIKDKLEKRIKSFGGTIIFYDVDDLKKVNEVFGYKTGDLYLKEISNYIYTTLKTNNKNRNSLYPVRYGGDEFVIISIKPLERVDISEKNITYSLMNIEKNFPKKIISLDNIIEVLGCEVLKKKRNKKNF